MNKPLLAAGALLLAGVGTAGAVIVASSGGEEEVVQQVETAGASAAASPTQLASPTASETVAPTATLSIPDDWQTYGDPVLGFSLRYPPDLAFEEIPSGNPSSRHLQFRSPTDRTRSFTIGLVDPEELEPESWLLENAACRPGTVELGMVDGQIAAFCTSEPIKIPEAAVAFQHMGKMVFITSIMPTSEFDLVIASIRL